MAMQTSQAIALLQALKRGECDHASQAKSLDELRVLSRSPQVASTIAHKENLGVLCQIAFATDDDVLACGALRPIANALLLQPAGRLSLIELQGPEKLAKRLSKSQSYDHEFLCCRILFLLTYEASFDIRAFVLEHGLAEAITKCLEAHANSSNAATGTTSPMQAQALAETAKLLYNTLAYHSELEAKFTDAVTTIFALIEAYSKRLERPLDQPQKALINALLNLDVFAASDVEIGNRAEKLISILDVATASYQPGELNTEIMSLLTLLRKMFDSTDGNVQHRMKSRLLPADEDRHLPLGDSDTLSSRLLRLTSSSAAKDIKDLILGLLYEMSDKNPARFVQNIGLGHAAGYLMNNNIALPDLRGSSDITGRGVHPVTGQFIDEVDDAQQPAMSEEEKEREAERLFVLFERLKATGVVDVQNPVEEAARSGRLG